MSNDFPPDQTAIFHKIDQSPGGLQISLLDPPSESDHVFDTMTKEGLITRKRVNNTHYHYEINENNPVVNRWREFCQKVYGYN